MSFSRHVRSLSQNVRGQVAVIFALCLVPLLMFAGAAIDYSRVLTAQESLQQSADATALAMAQSAASLSTAELDAQTQSFLTATSHDPNAQTTVTYTSGTLCVDATSAIPTTLTQVGQAMGLTVQPTMAYAARSCAAIGGGTFEVAMALDNTGSMGEFDPVSRKTKIQSEVEAATNLVNTVFAGQPTSSTYQISIVPFTTAVNVGTQYADASWVDTTGSSSIAFENLLFPSSGGEKWKPASRFDLFSALGVSWGGCFEQRPQPYTFSDTPASIDDPNTLFEPLFAPDEPDSGNLKKNQSSWNNYITDDGGDCAINPDKNLAKNLGTGYFPDGVAFPVGHANWCKYKGQTTQSLDNPPWGPNWGCDSTLAPLQTLTNEKSTLVAEFDKMKPGGNTDLSSGLMWAWRSISPNGPFESNGNIKPYNYTSSSGLTNTKVIVFMTDGFNNWYSPSGMPDGGVYTEYGYFDDNRAGALPVTVNGATTSQTVNVNNSREFLDAAFLQECTNAKAAGVVIFTIGFSISFDPIDSEGKQVLQSCASEPSMAYIATNGNQIVNIFGSVGTQIGQLRLTQ